jgi:nucleotide-binding universal stress UspA family protein
LPVIGNASLPKIDKLNDGCTPRTFSDLFSDDDVSTGIQFNQTKGEDMIEKILVPLDGSKTAEMILPYAAEIAAKNNSSIFLISVCDPHSENIERIYKFYLERIAGELRSTIMQKGAKSAAVFNEVLSGNPAGIIVNFAFYNKVGLIMLSNHGPIGHDPRVVTRVLNTTKIPVLHIKPSDDEKTLEPGQLFKKILIPLNGSKRGEAAVQLFEDFFGASESEVVLFQSVHFSEVDVSKEEWEKPSRDYLTRVSGPLKQKGYNVKMATVEGDPINSIVNYAKLNDVDLIIMSSHGHTPIERLLFSPVTESVLHSGSTPLLIIRAN